MARVTAVLSIMLFLVADISAGDDAPPLVALEKRLTTLARGHKGTVEIAIKNLLTGETIFINADEVLPTASLIKFPVMLEAYMQALEGKLKLTDMVTLKEADKV